MTTPPVPVPDDKDWTWVLGQTCAECGYDSTAIATDELAARSLQAIATLHGALTRDDASVRPEPDVWSALEYGCHVRDVASLFRTRLQSMRDEDDPLFANWDQDETALEQRYWEQQPAIVAAELDGAARQMATTIDQIQPAEWSRPGRRSNGSVFTVESLCRYYLHDLVHHAHDVSRP